MSTPITILKALLDAENALTDAMRLDPEHAEDYRFYRERIGMRRWEMEQNARKTRQLEVLR